MAAPRVFGFDTGFVCYHRGWNSLREENKGQLWEHFVLNEIQGVLQKRTVQYWRDKRGHEVDFVYEGRKEEPVAIECKWSADDFDSRGLLAFRRQYPSGKNYVVAADVTRSYLRKYNEVSIQFVNLSSLLDRLI